MGYTAATCVGFAFAQVPNSWESELNDLLIEIEEDHREMAARDQAILEGKDVNADVNA